MKEQREIKFRGISKKTNEFLYGDLVQWERLGLAAILPQEGDKWSSPNDFEVKPETVGEYTGLKDKNGVEIWGGDILISDGTYGIVIFNEGEFVVLENTHHDDKTTWPMRCWAGDEGEIIGNIHTNPELLEK